VYNIPLSISAYVHAAC